MTSRTNIRSRLTFQKEGKERPGWRTSSSNRGEEEAQAFQRSASTYRTEPRSERSLNSASTFYISPTTADNQNDVCQQTTPKLEFHSPREDWRRTFNMKLDPPSKEETQPPDQQDQQAFSSFANLSETFHCKNGRDSILQGSSEKLNGNTFESPRFQSLRWKTKRDLKLLSQRYTQNQEDWKIPSHANHSQSNNVPQEDWKISSHANHSHSNNVPQNSESVVSTNGVERPTNTFEETSVDPAFEDHANKSQGLLTTPTDSNYEVYSFSRSKTVQSNPEKRFTERNVELPFHRNTNYLDKSSRLDDDNNLDYSPHLDSSSSQFHETHFDSNHINDSSDVLSPRSSRDRQSWTENDDNSSVSDGQSKSRKKLVNESKKDFEDESYFDEDLSAGDSFARGGSRRTSKQQAGFRGAVHGLLARIGKKLNKNETSKMTKDEKIIAIMLQKKKDEEREEREREEAHARWEAEREELQRNSATRRSIDPSFRRTRRKKLSSAAWGLSELESSGFCFRRSLEN